MEKIFIFNYFYGKKYLVIKGLFGGAFFVISQVSARRITPGLARGGWRVQ